MTLCVPSLVSILTLNPAPSDEPKPVCALGIDAIGAALLAKLMAPMEFRGCAMDARWFTGPSEGSEGTCRLLVSDGAWIGGEKTGGPKHELRLCAPIDEPN